MNYLILLCSLIAFEASGTILHEWVYNEATTGTSPVPDSINPNNVNYKMTLLEGARITSEGLSCSGGYGKTAGSIPQYGTISHTLEARVKFTGNVFAWGSSPLALDSDYNPTNGHYGHRQFDAIVNNENSNDNKWIAGSDHFRRTKKPMTGNGVVAESLNEWIHIMISYNVEHNLVTIYRNGEQYGDSYRPRGGFMNINDQVRAMACIRHLRTASLIGTIAYAAIHKGAKTHADVTNAYMHIGCYRDSWSRALRYGPQQYGYTIASCSTACPTYKYFALQHGSWCCCDNDLGHAKKYGAAPAGACPTNQLGGVWANDIFQKSNGVHYAFVTDKKTFSQAKEYCINSYPDGHLAVISDRDENEKVTEKCQNIGQLQAACWIGLTNPAISGNKWLDGTPITYTHWYDNGDGGYSQPCTTMRADGLWHTVGYCENGGAAALPFICEYTVSGAYSKPGLFLENLSFDSSGISMYWMYIIAILLFINVVCFAIYWCKCGKSSHQYKVVSVDSSDVEA